MFALVYGTPSNSIQFSAYMDPLVIGVNASVKVQTVLLDMKLLDYSKEWIVTDRIQLSPEPIKF